MFPGFTFATYLLRILLTGKELIFARMQKNKSIRLPGGEPAKHTGKVIGLA